MRSLFNNEMIVVFMVVKYLWSWVEPDKFTYECNRQHVLHVGKNQFTNLIIKRATLAVEVLQSHPLLSDM